MAVDEVDLTTLLDEFKDIPNGADAARLSVEAEIPLARRLLKEIFLGIKTTIQNTDRSFNVSLALRQDSPVVSLIVAVLRKKKMKVSSQGGTNTTVLVIEW